MTLDEAIQHCEEVANGMTAQGDCKECAEEHKQLAQWLSELKQLKGQELYVATEMLSDDELKHLEEQLKKTKLQFIPMEQEPKWIPCSERLPKERDWYLAVFKEIDTGFQLIPRVADYIGKDGKRWRIIDEEGLCQEYIDTLECVAWMPLPEPYKAESEDKE